MGPAAGRVFASDFGDCALPRAKSVNKRSVTQHVTVSSKFNGIVASIVKVHSVTMTSSVDAAAWLSGYNLRTLNNLQITNYNTRVTTDPQYRCLAVRLQPMHAL